MKKYFIFFLFFISKLLSQTDDWNYFPMRIGDQWKYYFINHESSVITEVGKQEGSHFVITENIYMGNLQPISKTAKYGVRDNNLEIVETGGGLLGWEYKPLNVPGVILKFPISKGNKWEFEYLGIKYKREIVNKHTEITVEGKSYPDVVEVKQIAYDIGDIRTTYEFYAYKVGLIKTEGLVNDKRVQLLSLYAFNLKDDIKYPFDDNSTAKSVSGIIEEESEHEIFDNAGEKEKETEKILIPKRIDTFFKAVTKVRIDTIHDTVKVELQCPSKLFGNNLSVGLNFAYPLLVGAKLEYDYNNFGLLFIGIYMPKIGKYDDTPPPDSVASDNYSFTEVLSILYNFKLGCDWYYMAGIYGGLQTRHWKKSLVTDGPIKSGTYSAFQYGVVQGAKYFLNDNWYLELAFVMGRNPVIDPSTSNILRYEFNFLPWLAVCYKF